MRNLLFLLFFLPSVAFCQRIGFTPVAPVVAIPIATDTAGTHTLAITKATGSNPKFITVRSDTDGYPALYLYRPTSTFPDKLERIVTY